MKDQCNFKEPKPKSPNNYKILYMFIFIHHSDLRIADNNTINYLIQNKYPFIPVFIGTPDQLNDNPYKSSNSIRFMVESLQELTSSYNQCGLKLQIYYGETIEVIDELIKLNPITGVAYNMDYSPYARDRDNKLEKYCKSQNIQHICMEDKLLNSIKSILTGKNTPYSKFTPYFNNASKTPVAKPVELKLKVSKAPTLKKSKYDSSLQYILDKSTDTSNDVSIIGGRSHALKTLQNIDKFHKRDIPSIQTTRLSAYLKFGCISTREAYYAFNNDDLIKQLYWRDFYNMILYYYGSFDAPVSITNPKFNNIPWDHNKSNLQRWKDGMTGCPIVDAGMREMNATGFMHNRVRMIVASFLIFYLKLDWREGMKYFSQKLVDADWANNLGNWQWTAGVEKWSNDYYKVFSMESQIQRFDPECKYIKMWIPELNAVPTKDIYNWDTNYRMHTINYPKPIITNNKAVRKSGIDMYSAIKSKS